LRRIICFRRKEGTFFFVIVDLQAVRGFACSWPSVLDIDLDLEIAPDGERADNVLKVKRETIERERRYKQQMIEPMFIPLMINIFIQGEPT
jgi:hypothetical protein